MTDQTQKNTPNFNVFHVTKDEQSDRWIKLGAAWNNQDGLGLNIRMDSIPFDFDGKLVLRAVKPS